MLLHLVFYEIILYPIMDYSGLLGLIEAYWEDLAPLP